MDIKEAQQQLKANAAKGIRCPCCNQLVKIYKRHFNAGMAYSLILLLKMDMLSPGRWIHVQDEFSDKYNVLATALDYSQLKRWKLIERKPGERDDGAKSTGFWRITDEGVKVATRARKVNDTAIIYDNSTLRLEGKEIWIDQALKKKFNYNELMNS